MKKSGLIGKDYKQIKSYTDIEIFCKIYPKEEIKLFFVGINAYCLGSKKLGAQTPTSFSKIPDIRSIYGAGLKILSNSCSNISPNTELCANSIKGNIKKNNFKTYSIVDGILAYQCLNLKVA